MAKHIDAGNEFLSICKYCRAVEYALDKELRLEALMPVCPDQNRGGDCW